MNLSGKPFQDFAKRVQHNPVTRTDGLVLINEILVFTSSNGNGLRPPSIIDVFAYIPKPIPPQVIAYGYSEDPIPGWGRHICETGNGPVLVFLYGTSHNEGELDDCVKNSALTSTA